MKVLEQCQCFSKNSHCDIDLGPRTLKLKIHQDITILHICGKLNQNRSMNEGYRAMTMFFILKIFTVTLTLAYHNYLSNPESDL